MQPSSHGRWRPWPLELIEEVQADLGRLTVKETARRLGLPPHTIQNIRARHNMKLSTEQKSNLFEKIHVHRKKPPKPPEPQPPGPIPPGARLFWQNRRMLEGYREGLNPLSKEPAQSAHPDVWIGFALGREAYENRRTHGKKSA